jgi:uncharacterized protein (TIGR02996 family)
MEGESFLRGLDANPSDDTLRLVFADWLEERGDDRGQFLRAAVALRNSAASDGSFPHLLRRLRELRSAVSAEWVVRAFRDLAEDDVRAIVFRAMLGEASEGSGAFLQVECGRDPSPYLWAGLLERYASLRPASAAEQRSEGVFDKQTGERGLLASIHSMDWVAEGRCNIEGSAFFDGLAAQGNLYRVGIEDGHWSVLEVTGLWLS